MREIPIIKPRHKSAPKIPQEEKIRQVQDWGRTPPEVRSTKAKLMKKLGITDIRTFNNYLKDNGAEPDEEYNPEDYLLSKSKTIDDALIAACDRKSPGALKIYYQLTKRLIERQENINIDVSGDELTRRNLEAERRLRELGYGVEDVQEKPPLLSENIQSSTGQSVKGDN